MTFVTGHGGQVITPVPDTQAEAAPALLHEVFEQAARKHPEAIAIEVPPGPGRPTRTRITYAEADRRASALAARLAPNLAGEAVVAILLPRTTHDVYLAQLAVLKAGGAYTHLEPGAPADRLKYLIEDSAAVAVVTSRALRARVEAMGVPPAHIVEVDAAVTEPRHNGHAAAGRPRWLAPSTLAYVIYTSGTSGRPKGVMVEHRNVLNLVWSDRTYFDLRPGDRVGQSSSVAYDSSVEEIWLAFAQAATVVLMDDEVVRLGPDLVPWLRDERLTVFCPPPTLLRMCACDDPQRELPDLRLLYVGGEELPADVAARWAPGRRLENGYGPTECSVTVVRTPIRAGERVTIGHPVEGNRAWILDEELNEVADGAAGELCIGGRGVTRGYLGAPALTAERYIEHPRFGRIYRTGDLAERLPSGALAYLGRSDSQVKIRGHRVELAAIESSLSSCAGVVAAACRLQGAPSARELAAFLVTDGAGPPDLGRVRERMRELLPEHMQPVHYAVVPVLPTRDASGKLDRSALPDIGPEARRARPLAPARDALERAICEAFEAHLSAPGPVSIDHDFFLELGGNSLVAAQVISTLRRRAETASLTVRDVYEARTVAQLAARATRPAAAPATTGPAAAARARVSPAPGALVQLAWIGGNVAIGSALAYGAVFQLLPALERVVGRVPLLLALPLLAFVAECVWLPLSLLLAVTAKALLVGRYRAGRHAYMSAFHVRHWLVQQCARAIPWMLIEGTELQNACLRALGARIGRGVHLHRGTDVGGGWDLIEIGDGATLGRDSSLGPAEFDRRELVLAPVRIGPGATLDTRAHVAGGARIERDGFLGPLSLLPADAVLAQNERWDGVPAARIDAAPAAAATEPAWGPWPHAFTLLGLRGAIAIVPLLPGLALAALCLGATRPPGAVTLPVPLETLPPLLLPVLFVAGYALSLPIEALLARALGRIEPGTHALRGWTGIAASVKDCLVERANAVLSGTLLWPLWLRAAGARVGARCEISTIMEVIPELLEVGDECFFADGIYLGRPLLHRGTIACAPTRLSSNTFLGNHVVVPAGAELPPDILLGICTVADPSRIRSGTSWFGLPAFELPRREIAAADRDLTHDPSWPRVLNRVCFEWVRLALPLVPALLAWAWFVAAPQWRAGQSALRFYLFTLPLGTVVAGAALCALAVAVKWLVLGPIREGRHALWSCWCCRWDLLYEVWAGWAGPVLAPFEGTPFVSWWLRAMGCRIGHGVVFGSAFLQVVDPDMLVIEDGATVACHVQSHSFEDRVLKLAPVRIGAGSSVGRGAVLLYGADIGDGASVGDNSIVMKHESLLPRLRYVGCPTRAGSPAEASA